MAPKKSVTSTVTMEDVFQYMKAVRDEHGVRIGFGCYPTVDDSLNADFGFVVQVRNMDGRIIREVYCQYAFWPSSKYTSWEAAVMDCLHAVDKQLTEDYLPLLAYISGTK